MSNDTSDEKKRNEQRALELYGPLLARDAARRKCPDCRIHEDCCGQPCEVHAACTSKDSSGYTALGPSTKPFQHGKFAFKTWEDLSAHIEYAVTDEHTDGVVKDVE